MVQQIAFKGHSILKQYVKGKPYNGVSNFGVDVQPKQAICMNLI